MGESYAGGVAPAGPVLPCLPSPSRGARRADGGRGRAGRRCGRPARRRRPRAAELPPRATPHARQGPGWKRARCKSVAAARESAVRGDDSDTERCGTVSARAPETRTRSRGPARGSCATRRRCGRLGGLARLGFADSEIRRAGGGAAAHIGAPAPPHGSPPSAGCAAAAFTAVTRKSPPPPPPPPPPARPTRRTRTAKPA
jgi:hypothetical protein